VDAAGLATRLDAARGAPLLLVFWATWCKPCVDEIPQLVELHRQGPDGLRVLAVSLDSFLAGAEKTPGVVRAFLDATPTPYDHLLYMGSQDALFDTFELPGSIPYAILYDARGAVVGRFEGAVAPGAVRAALRPAAG
jgi:thiol-disulfide isomerase/thioredoxin